jgi:hypothetical protein
MQQQTASSSSSSSSCSSTYSSSIVGVLSDSATSVVLDICIVSFTQLHSLWPGSAPLTAAALRPCFQPVVELAWTVLEAGAAAGLFEDGNSSSSRHSLWDCQLNAVLNLASSLAHVLGAVVAQRLLVQWQPHAQQFASDELLKLLMVVAGFYVGDQYKQQQQQQQQQGHVCVQPYHQQLLAELQVQPWGLPGIKPIIYTGHTLQYSYAALALALKMRATVLASGSSSSGVSSSGSSGGTASRAHAQPAAATTAVPPSISIMLHELMLLTVLECAVLASATDPYGMSQALASSIYLHHYAMNIVSSSTAAGAAMQQPQANPPSSEVLLRCLLLEVAPAVLRSTRCTTAASTATFAAVAAASGNAPDPADERRPWRALMALSERMLQDGKLPAAKHSVTSCSQRQCMRLFLFLLFWVKLASERLPSGLMVYLLQMCSD